MRNFSWCNCCDVFLVKCIIVVPCTIPIDGSKEYFSTFHSPRLSLIIKFLALVNFLIIIVGSYNVKLIINSIHQTINHSIKCLGQNKQSLHLTFQYIKNIRQGIWQRKYLIIEFIHLHLLQTPDHASKWLISKWKRIICHRKSKKCVNQIKICRFIIVFTHKL